MKNFFRLVAVDFHYNITDFRGGLKVLCCNIDTAVCKHLVNLVDYARIVLVDVKQAAYAVTLGWKRNFREVYCSQG